MKCTRSLLAERISLAILVSSIAWVGESSRAAAQTPEGASSARGNGGGIEELTVTAQRREESAQDVGVSLSAVGAEDMRRLAITNAKDISKFAPGVLLDSIAGGGYTANLTIRGIAQTDFSSTQESPNSLYLDDVYNSSPNAAAFSLYDLNRIEVLRGPQGTLFGRASSGGLANFITNRPSETLEGYVDLGYSSFNNIYTEAAVGGPLSDRVRYRVAGRIEKADGWFENGTPGGDDTFEKDFRGGRIQLEADLTERLTGRFSFSYDENPKHREGTYDSKPGQVVDGEPELLPADVDAWGTGPGNDLVGYRDPYGRFNKGKFNDYGYLDSKRVSPTLTLSYDLGEATLTSIANYTGFEYDYLEDCDGGEVDYCSFGSSQDLDQYSEELRVNGTHEALTYTAGLYYLNISQTAPQFFSFPVASGTDFAFASTNSTDQDLESYAVFGQLEYQLTPTVTGIVGLRYTNEEKKLDAVTAFPELGAALGGIGVFEPPLVIYEFSKATVGGLAEESEGLWSGKLQLNYAPDDDSLFYASVSRGIKPAGFNTNLAGTLSIEDTSFKSEYVYAYEVGTKLDMLDRKLRLNASAFYYDYHRFQGFAFTLVSSVVGNYDGYFKGAELDLTLAPRDDVDLRVGVSYLQSELQDVASAYGGVSDVEASMAPEWTATASAAKRFELSMGTLELSWDANFTGDRYASIDNNRATFVPDSFVHNARATLYLDGGVDLSAFVNNISNEDRVNYALDGMSTGGYFIRSHAPPRWMGVSVRKSF